MMLINGGVVSEKLGLHELDGVNQMVAGVQNGEVWLTLVERMGGMCQMYGEMESRRGG